MLAVGVGLLQISRQHVVQGRDVGAALNAGVPAQRQHAAARPPGVAQQRLDDPGAPDHLNAGAVMGPADRVADGAGRSRPELRVIASHTFRKVPAGHPVTRSTISGV